MRLCGTIPTKSGLPDQQAGLRRAILAAVLALFLWDQASATPTVITAGPYNLTFFNSGDSDAGTTSAQNWTSQQMNDVAASVTAWSGSIYNTPGRQINLHLLWFNFGSTTLGATSCPNNGNGTLSYTYPEHVWRDGVNYTGRYTGYDSQMMFDTTAAGTSGGWNFGSGAPLSNQMDFRSIVTHELGHTVGFYDTYVGTSRRGTWGNCFGTETNPNGSAGYQGIAEWDMNLRDPQGDLPANGSSGTPGRFSVTGNPDYWVGSYAVAAYGGNVPIYAPSTFSGGSSLSHLDYNTFPNALMSPFRGPGDNVRQPSPLEFAMMKDMGWTIIETWGHGAGTLNWSDTGNWNMGNVPDRMNHVVLTNTGLAGGNTLVLGGNQTIDSLGIDSTLDFTIGGSAGTLTLAHGLIDRTTSSAAVQTIARPVALGANGIWTLSGAGQFVVSGPVSGATQSLEKRGTGMLVLSGSNSYGGGTSITAGTLNIQNSAALGAASAGVTVADGATLELQGGIEVDSEALSLSGSGVAGGGALRNIGGANTWMGSVILATTSTVAVAADSLTISGHISGTGGLMKTGPGTLALTNTTSNFTGPVTLVDGRTTVFHANNLGSNTASNALTFGGGTLGVTGTFTMNRPVTVGATGGAVDVTDGQTVTLAGSLSIAASATLTKTGQGAMTLSGSAGHGNGANLLVHAGTLTFGSDPGTNSARNLNLTADGTSAVNFASSTHYLKSLTLGNTAMAAIQSGGGRTLITNALTFAGGATPTAKLDQADGNLIVHYSGASPLQQVAGWILSGMGTTDPNTGSLLWNGNGITSSKVALNPDKLGLGVIDNAYTGTVDWPRTPLSTLDGVAVQTNDVLVKYTSLGDIDLSSSTNKDDYDTFKHYYGLYNSPNHGGLNPADIGWQTGDLNMDGQINKDDYDLFKAGYGFSYNNGPLGAGVVALEPLPEPATLSLLVLGGLVVLRRVRRRGR
jgi:autotransporter-associated beta strand protein